MALRCLSIDVNSASMCMRMISVIVSVLFFFSLLGSTSSIPQHEPQSHIPTEALGHVRTIYEWPIGSWAENLAVMSNGSILVTHLNLPQLWHVNPFTRKANLIAEIEGYIGLLGITETEPGLFAFIAGNFSLEKLSPAPGTYAVWQADTRTTPFTISRLADVPQAAFLNGMDRLGPDQRAVLMSDSDQGLIYRFELGSGKTAVAIDSPFLKKCRPTDLEGINGLKVHSGYVWFTNAYCGFFASIPIDASGSAVGPTEIRSYTDKPGTWIYDDLAVTHTGAAYLAGGTENVLVEAVPSRLLWHGSGAGEDLGNGTALWARRIVAGALNSTAIAEPTAVQVGRTRRDQDVLYVTTGGGLGGPINGTVIVGGQIVAVDLKRRSHG